MGALETVESGRQVGDLANRIVQARREALDLATAAINEWRWTRLQALLSDVEVERLQEVAGGRVRVSALLDCGIVSVAEVLALPVQQLQSIPGVGSVTAQQLSAAAHSLAAEMERVQPPRFDIDHPDVQQTEVLARLWVLMRMDAAIGRSWDDWVRAADEVPGLTNTAMPATSRFNRLLASPSRRRHADSAVASLARWLHWARGVNVTSVASKVDLAVAALPLHPNKVWSDYERNSVGYYTTLESVAGVASSASHGDLAEAVATLVDRQNLDDSMLKVALRGYQAFGARFALSQVRCILGDEMGLGKTVQAIAALAHHKAEGADRFLVVCPASVLVNWDREITRHSHLVPIRVHGPHMSDAYARWEKDGGVAITTFEMLRRLPARFTDMLVIDEAHYIKNPSAGRSVAAREWIDAAGWVLLMSGTPVENRVEELVQLISYVQPDTADELGVTVRSLPAELFRDQVAPVYLRRNATDVLTELPDLIESNEWCDFTSDDLGAYKRAVAEGNFMAMRRAGYSSADTSRCAKLARLVELVDEAQEQGRKVVVFSYFRDVLDTVGQALGPRVLGPLTGSTNPADRQLLIDQFMDAPDAPVLLSQIVAGGTGLNIQAASVVILCEPQVKPSLESQAIKRTHRIGQVRSVAVHRLLAEDSVDERMLELLAIKADEAHRYAERSSVAAASPSAVDISEASLAEQIIQIERQRLGLMESE